MKSQDTRSRNCRIKGSDRDTERYSRYAVNDSWKKIYRTFEG